MKRISLIVTLDWSTPCGIYLLAWAGIKKLLLQARYERRARRRDLLRHNWLSEPDSIFRR
jgi:hypothetical protein